ncbi:DUF1996 domain-containing protein [Prauserella muralis]|uniref:DUF1996 domain-containing protein n=1 Tax=Prauserella muralis TaxID=588067 RepID=A0A2V4B1M3_9PSEU|nr:DUF1996 domain-containing protein [Prauserella muralis]PXY28180.1 hypothetical protein BAY60_17785 [Prauserella muralis]TWE22006.1 uncharacterized protein DUF1996 [Prauserella muralis]
MPRNQGRHRLARRTKIATGALGFAIAVGALVVTTTTGETGKAAAGQADPSRYVDITTVQPNVQEPPAGENASTGTFTVDCGTNEEGHFNADNVIAQPGVNGGAQHVHTYVGNLSTNADSTNESLLEADTTCANGDKSTYYWPVLRIDREAGEATGRFRGGPRDWRAESRRTAALRAQARQTATRPGVECPDVVTRLPNVPARAMTEVNRALATLDRQIAEADRRLETARGEGGPNFVRNAILGPLQAKRRAVLDRIRTAIDRFAERPGGLGGLDGCDVRDDEDSGIDNGDENGDGDDSQDGQFPEPQGPNLELPGNEGEIQRETSVELTFRGNAAGPVTAMPQFLRVLTGQAKPTANGDALARPSFTCSGFEDRLVDTYVVCPEGSQVMRVHDFPSCWDGQNVDSPNHRDHIVFPDEATGQCPDGFTAVPQLRITLTYDIPRAVQEAGQYTIDSFPEEDNNPASDHDDFANVMGQDLMNRVVNCINDGQTCNE